jgi:uncharacterized cupin superfamily protein
MPKIDLASVPVRKGTGYPPEDGGETVLRAGDYATFPKGTGNGHHLINKSAAMAAYLEVGSRNPNDLTTCSDIDMMSSNADGRFVHKDRTPYPES